MVGFFFPKRPQPPACPLEQSLHFPPHTHTSLHSTPGVPIRCQENLSNPRRNCTPKYPILPTSGMRSCFLPPPPLLSFPLCACFSGLILAPSRTDSPCLPSRGVPLPREDPLEGTLKDSFVPWTFRHPGAASEHVPEHAVPSAHLSDRKSVV